MKLSASFNAGFVVLAALLCPALVSAPPGDELARGFLNPPADARPHVYWLWLNGYVDAETARAELEAMKEAGIGGVLLFDMGGRGDKSALPPAGPAFLGDDWLRQLQESVGHARRLGLQVDLSVVSSWDLGGHWIEPRHASMGLYATETEIEGGQAVDIPLPFPDAPPEAPKGVDGKPAFWRDIAVLGLCDARRQSGHEFVIRLDPEGAHELQEVVLDNGAPQAPAALAATMTPARDFSVAVSTGGTRKADFREVIRGTLASAPGPQGFPLGGVRARHVRLTLLSGHDPTRNRVTLGEFAVFDRSGVNVAAARGADRTRSGALMVRGSPALTHDQSWNLENLHDGAAHGPVSVFASAGLPPFAVPDPGKLVDLTARIDATGRLRWAPPPGRWTVLRYVCMNTGERLKVPSPASDGWATDHLNGDATRAHMDYALGRLRTVFPDLAGSGLRNVYLASYEVRGLVWSPSFAEEFRRRRGYDMSRFLPALFGAAVGDEETAERFLFDYRKTLGEVLVDAYYGAAREAAHRAGLAIKSEAGGPGPPVHNVPVDALLANGAVDEVQGEFWPFWPDADAMWVVKETAAAAHIYSKPRVHMEAFTSFEGWREGPQDLKPAADRVFCEGGNHMVWHTWSHAPPEAGKPGWAYLAGTHLNRNVTWWPKARPFIDYLSRVSFLLQRGQFVADVLYYYGDGGYKFVGPRKVDPELGPGFDYDFTNSDVILNRLSVRNGRLTLPDGTSYAVLSLPDEQEAHPAVLEKLEKLVEAGATVVGPKPSRACGLEGQPESDRRVRECAGRLWGGLDGIDRTERRHGKGRVIWGVALREVLHGMKVHPDVAAPRTLDFIHRTDGNADIYFVRNTTRGHVEADVSFRVADRRPELWDPVSGRMDSEPPHGLTVDRMHVLLKLDPYGSVFVLFRKPAAGGRPALRVSSARPALRLDKGWQVEFQGAGAPSARMMLDRLMSWTEHPDPSVRFFSGTARYRNTFALSKEWLARNRHASIDLGRLWTTGQVWLNGEDLGIVWTPPFRVDCRGRARAGVNELVVEVTNTWFNRLAGDARLPAAQRLTRTNVTTSGGKPWADLDPIESGLFGPVLIGVF